MALGVGLLGWYARRTGTAVQLQPREAALSPSRDQSARRSCDSGLTVFTSRDFFILAAALLVIAGLAEPMLYAFAPTASGWLLFVAGSMLPRRSRPATDAA
jgi:hypothetical protein